MYMLVYSLRVIFYIRPVTSLLLTWTTLLFVTKVILLHHFVAYVTRYITVYSEVMRYITSLLLKVVILRNALLL